MIKRGSIARGCAARAAITDSAIGASSSRQPSDVLVAARTDDERHLRSSAGKRLLAASAAPHVRAVRDHQRTLPQHLRRAASLRPPAASPRPQHLQPLPGQPAHRLQARERRTSRRRPRSV